ncbi:winged helix-turn-helix domain-containing protein [Pseudomonadota bacterium]
MLKELAIRPGQIKSPSKLMSMTNIVVEDNTIAANIKTIQKHFRTIDADFQYIKTEYGVGYRWLAD